MRMGTVKSSLISKLGFSGGPGETGTLRVEYKDGAVFDYSKVLYSVFRRLVTMKHPGTWWTAHRDGYKFNQVS